MNIIENRTFPEERALYESRGILVKNCRFEGEEDGESALKECSDVAVENSFFALRYPFWHDRVLSVSDCELTASCRAALWYSSSITLKNTLLHGIKALRECSGVLIEGCDIISPEFGWNSRGVTLRSCRAEGEYFMMRGEDLDFKDLKFTGKYSFQYIKNAKFSDCDFDTKDAFWHAENVLVENSVIKGEYLAWYSKALTLRNCKIIGTQPLCCCEDLVLENCEMHGCDLAFEKSTVTAEVTTPIISVKNPVSGVISAPKIGEIIIQDDRYQAQIKITG